MKWFIKCLKHYADFSGRARRKEYWMFVLFNIIFSIAWVFLLSLAFALFRNPSNDNDEMVMANLVANFAYLFIMLLPGMAVAVRRLHDTGRSGWMLLVGLIPVIGGIWLFVLMLLDGQQGENKYGADPKTVAEVFSDKAKLASVGITLIVVSCVAILGQVFYFSAGAPVSFMPLSFFAGNVLLLAAGVFLLSEKQVYGMEAKGRSAIMVILVAVGIHGMWALLSIAGLIQRFSPPHFWADTLSYLLVALFAATILFLPKNKNMVRNTAISIILFFGLCLLWRVYGGMGWRFYDLEWWKVVLAILDMFGLFTEPVAFILLAGTFLSKKSEGAARPEAGMLT
ncbi:MAG: DUF805 domain-containing protein [Azoarcus sp.]|jgi:uncharacterized membrane protein YhaH (DUF805 family)|nr:DUF805 domain-containing protein [Azoarcus sp.]